MPTKSLAPKQERSKQTLESLLTATLKVLDKEGLENATIPAIAKAAGVAPASVYRRFADKDDLIRSAFLCTIEASSKAVQGSITPEKFAGKTFETAARSLLASFFVQYRQHPKLLAAMKRFSERELESAFEKQITEIFAQNFRTIVKALCACKDVGKLKNKERKIQFGLMAVVTCIEIMVLEPTSLWNVLLNESDEAIQKHLLEMLLSYVGM